MRIKFWFIDISFTFSGYCKAHVCVSNSKRGSLQSLCKDFYFGFLFIGRGLNFGYCVPFLIEVLDAL